MRFYKHLYLSERYRANPNVIKAKLRLRKFFFSMNKVMLICLCENTDELEFFQAGILLQPHYKKKRITIIGIAENRESAIELIEEIVSDSMKTTYGYKLKEYLKAKEAGLI